MASNGHGNGFQEMDEAEYLDPTLYFERGRIKQLQDERIHIQKKTFTKWCNSFLNRARLEIVDLFTDVCDGVLLLKLLEIISGDKLGKPNRGRMRVHKIENLNKVLDFLKRKKIHMENIGAEDILDRNERLILGLIWTIILRFQIEDIEIEVGEEESGERKRAKDALLIWCQRKTAGYPSVEIKDFTGSWRNGLGFNALIHAHRPDLINYSTLNPHDHIANLNNAFDVAEKKLGIARLLDAEDVDVNRPDDKSVITYVSMYYHYFAKQKSELTGAKRIAKVVGQLMNAEQMVEDYESISTDLLEWIRLKIESLNDRHFPNSLKGIQEQLLLFKQYRTVEKPPKYKDKGELEALFFTLQTKRKAMGRPAYSPPEGLLLKDIEANWEKLDRSEHSRQVALSEELLRQERLEQLARKFQRKAKLRETWLREMTGVLQDFDFGNTVALVEANVKKHEAIAADILPREDRFKTLSTMAGELAREKYHDTDKIRAREREIVEKWAYLLQALERRRQALMSLNDLMTLLRDIDTLSTEFSQLEPSVKNRDLGKHILGVEDLLQKHTLVEAQIVAQGEWLKNIAGQAQDYIRSKGEQHELLQNKLSQLEQQYTNLMELSRSRRNALERARELYQFIQDHEEEEGWLIEKHRVCVNMLQNRDLSQTPQLHRLFKSLETEMQGHWQRSKQVLNTGEKLLQVVPPTAKEEVQQRIASLQTHWDELRQISGVLGRWLKEAQQASQYFQDANEAESWMREKQPLVCSDDFGKDELSAQSLLSRHSRLEEEIGAYKTGIEQLEELAEELSKAEFLSSVVVENGSAVEPEKVVEERFVAQVKVLYRYEGDRVSVQKGQLLSLIQKTNNDWWRISTPEGEEGYVPANYVKEVDSKVIRVEVPAAPGEKPPLPKRNIPQTSDPDSNPILERQKHISAAYRRLTKLAQTRRRYLADAIKLYRFYRECDEFEAWVRETEKLLHEDPSSEHVEAFRKKFNNLVTDITANGGTRLTGINNMADELVDGGHSQKDHIRRRQEEINEMWKNLLKKRENKRQALETAESVAAFNQTCDETQAWMREKFDQLDQASDVKDLKALQAMQRRHKNLERELKPVEEKMTTLDELAGQVKGAYPGQSGAIDKKLAQLQSQWDELKRRAADRRRMLEETQGHQMFQGAVKDLLEWVDKTKAELKDVQKAVDVTSAEELLQRHYDLRDDIKSHEDEFAYVHQLGTRLLDKSPGLNDVQETLHRLSTEQKTLNDLWSEKEFFLKDMMELQLFNREADYVDAATKGHEAFLEINDLGNSVDEVENLRKVHQDFETKLGAQDERIQVFDATANSLIQGGHSEAPYVDGRRKDVIARRMGVKEKSLERRHKLKAALDYQRFKRDADELSRWIDEKMKVAKDDSYKDGTNLERKLQKHETFEAELKANVARLESLNSEGKELVRNEHFAKPQIQEILGDLNDKWDTLGDKTFERGEKLRQACDQKSLNRTLEDAHLKLNELERALASNDLGNDLRGVKQLIQKHTMLEQEMAAYNTRIKDIVGRGEAMAHAGHFDSGRILKAVKDFTTKFESLQDPAAKRRAQLEESKKFHQFIFDVDCELQWIAEKRPMASSKDCGRSLTEARNLEKKHEQLESEFTGHQPLIDQTLGKGDELLKANHYASADIKTKADELRSGWKGLKELVAERRAALNLALKGQQYLFDAAEIETWMGEKRSLLLSDDYGQDEDSANKLLKRHRAILDEMEGYRKWIESLGVQCVELGESGHTDREKLEAKQVQLEKGFSELETLADTRRAHLEDAVCLYQYLRESQELEGWINEQLQVAMSEEYGQDYEHLTELMVKFDDFKQAVKTGSERFVLCEEAAKALLERDPPFKKDVLQRQEKLRSAWSCLLDYIENRDQKLEAAEEIHRFNRDAQDALSRIHEKMSAIPDDLGRDINTVQSLLRRHEAFENELAALEAQLQVLLEDSGRLQKTYAGANAEHIASQQNGLVEAWNKLQEKTVQRRDDLNAAYDLQRFLATARDLIGWSQEVVAEMQMDQPVRDLTGVELLEKEHARLKAELQARGEDFTSLADMADQMIQAEHYAKEEVADKINQVEQARDVMFNEWDLRSQWLEQLSQWHAFRRDAKQLLANITTHEATLKSGDVGGSVEEVNTQMKKHDTFEKVLEPLEERVVSLHSNAKDLITAKHMESPNMDQLDTEVGSRWKGLIKLVQERKLTLQDALLNARFNSDVAEAEGWIDEKRKRLSNEAETQGQLSSLQDKMKRLQKHQAFEAELAANSPRIEQIQAQGDELLRKHHLEEAEIRGKKENLRNKWDGLVKASQDQSRALEEARDLLDFNQLVDRVLAWIRDKELMVNTGEMGNDYEHCQQLLKRLEDSESDSGVDEQTLKTVNRLGEKLVKQGRSDKKHVQQQLDELNKKWNETQGTLEDYRKRLGAALEVHSFNRDVDDTNQRIGEKAVLLGSEDYGNNLRTVEALLRKQDEVERDMTAIHEKLRAHDAEAQNLLSKKPPLQQSIIDSLRKLEESWERLTMLANERRNKLIRSHTLQKFFDSVKKSEQWASNMQTKFAAYAPPNSVIEAQALLDSHVEKQAEIKGRQEELTSLREYGNKLLQDQPDHKGEIQRAGKRLATLEQEVNQNWASQNHRLNRYYHMQIFQDQVGLAEDWLTSKEAFLNQEDLGDSLDTVDALVKKHDGFEKAVRAQSDKIETLQKDSAVLKEKDPENEPEIVLKQEVVTVRHSNLLQKCDNRRGKLEDSRQWHLFMKTCHEVMTWLNAKLQITYDESYLEPINLQSKLQKHQAFDAEIKANQGQIEGVNEEGENLINRNHFAKEQITAQLKEINTGWEELVSKSKLKAHRLQEAYDAHLFNRKLEDLDKWLDKVEHQLASEDHGKDITSVTNLIGKHETLVQEITSRDSQIQETNETAMNFANSGHFMATQMMEKSKSVAERYHSLQEPCLIRKDNLREALSLYQWLKEVEEESTWIKEVTPQAGSTNVGDNLQMAQNLQKKHLAIEQEMVAREPGFARIQKEGHEMAAAKHYACAQIKQRVEELESEMDVLREKIAIRKTKLKDSIESQQYLSEANEAEQWMRDRMPIVTSTEVGKDEDSSKSLLRKLDTVEKDVEVYRSEINRLAESAKSMNEREHFDSARVSSKQTKLESDYAELSRQCQQRRTQLVDGGKYYGYLRQVDDLMAWLKEKDAAANSEDYGRDLDDCQQLIHSFEHFVRELASAGERVAAVQRLQEDLLRTGHPYSASIKAKGSDLQQLWADVNETATERRQALQGAMQVHRFDQVADETLNWLQEKEALQVVAEQEDLSQLNLPAIKKLLQSHHEFQRGVSAVEKRVKDLCKEAERLESQFPDTRDHLEVRRQDMEEQLKDILSAASQHQRKLVQAQELQAYFKEYRDFMAWIQQMQSTVTSESLPRDVPGCEALAQRHEEYRAEIRSREPQIDEFGRTGREMIRNGHLLASEIQEKVTDLEYAYKSLKEVWEERKVLYDRNLDAQVWKRDAMSLEAWLVERERYLGEDWRHADSVSGVEDLIQEYDDFLTTLNVQGDRFEALKKLTLLEQAFSSQKEKEQERKKQEEVKKEKQRKDQIMTLEKQKILQERRQERERRKTQEISFFKPHSQEQAPPPPPRRQSDPKLSAVSVASSESEPTTVSLVHTASPEEGSSSGATPLTSKPPLPPKPLMGRLEPPQDRQRTHSGDEASSSATPQHSISPPGSYNARDIRKAQSFKEHVTPGIAGRKGTSGKKTPNFTTRRPHSLKKVRQWDDMAQIDMSGFLERKQELQSGGKKATIRSWKQYYTILCGQLLCFFKDEEAFMDNMAASPPIYILGARSEPCPDYHKRKNTFRLTSSDGAEYLLSAPVDSAMAEWVAKISFHASLPPSLQLKSFDQRHQQPSASGQSQPSQVPPQPSLPPPTSPPPAFPHTSQEEETPHRPQPQPRRHSSKADSGIMSPPENGSRGLHSPDINEADREMLGTPPPPPIPYTQPPSFLHQFNEITSFGVSSFGVNSLTGTAEAMGPMKNGFHAVSVSVNGHQNGHPSGQENGYGSVVSTTHRYRGLVTVVESSGDEMDQDGLNGNGVNGHHEKRAAFSDLESTTDSEMFNDHPSASKSATLPVGTAVGSLNGGGDQPAGSKGAAVGRSASLSTHDSDFIAWTESTPDGSDLADGKEKHKKKGRGFGSIFKSAKKHRESSFKETSTPNK